jgi:hypothetical protein
MLTPTLVAITLLSNAQVEKADPRDTWRNNARFFMGARTGVGFSPGGQGPSPTFGLELGVSNRSGVGFGLHLLGSTNPQAVPALNIPRAGYGFGGAADLRIYIQTVNPLTLYPSISLGFLTGPDAMTGANVVLPLFILGFGARVRFGPVYAAVEIGLASFHIPFVSLCLGYESKPRYEPAEEDGLISEPEPEPEPAKAVIRRPPVAAPTPGGAEAEWQQP